MKYVACVLFLFFSLTIKAEEKNIYCNLELSNFKYQSGDLDSNWIFNENRLPFDIIFKHKDNNKFSLLEIKISESFNKNKDIINTRVEKTLKDLLTKDWNQINLSELEEMVGMDFDFKYFWSSNKTLDAEALLLMLKKEVPKKQLIMK